MNDDLGERIKGYEIDKPLDSKYLGIRIDGNAFSKWVYTNGLTKPFSKELHTLFIDTATFLLKECNGILAYTQSDEISIILRKDKTESEHYLGGKPQKLCSIMGSFTTQVFNDYAPNQYKPATFDCRVFPIPSDIEAANTVLWRVQDCARNSVLSAARSFYTHKELDGKSVRDCLDLLKAKHVEWELYSPRFKYGTFIKFIRDASGKRLIHEVIPKERPDFKYLFEMVKD